MVRKRYDITRRVDVTRTYWVNKHPGGYRLRPFWYVWSAGGPHLGKVEIWGTRDFRLRDDARSFRTLREAIQVLLDEGGDPRVGLPASVKDRGDG